MIDDSFKQIKTKQQNQQQQNNLSSAHLYRSLCVCFLVDPVYFYGICKLDLLINA